MVISVAIPCYKSEKTIEKVVEDAKKAILSREGNTYQFILVNDYPGDNTFDVIKRMCSEDENIIGINLTKNFGQQNAKMAAIAHFTGDVLVFMDDDGQHPSEGIYKLVDKICEGYDIVYAYFKSKKHSLFKRVTSNINSRISEFNGTKPKGIHISSFLAYSKATALSLYEYKSPFVSIGGYLSSVVDRVTDVEIEHKERIAGTSNYNLKKLLKLWLDGFTNFSVIPLRMVALVGTFLSLVGFGYGLFTIIRKLVLPNIAAGYTSLVSLLLFIGGLILIALGFIGEYIGRIYMTVSNMRQYAVKEVLNSKNDKD